MATAAFLKMNSASGTSVTSVTVSSVSMTAGRRIVVGVGISDPFNAATASNVLINGVTASADVAMKGSGSPFDWLSGGFWSITNNTTSTASVVVTLDKALSQANSKCMVIVSEVSSFNTASPVGATSSTQSNTATASATLASSANDVMFLLVNGGDGVNDRWLQTGSNTLTIYNDATSPGSSSQVQVAQGYNTASGTSSSLTWIRYGFAGGPITTPVEFLIMAAIYQNAGGGGSTASAFFAYSRNYLTAGAIV